jgi:hypothetical protein
VAQSNPFTFGPMITDPHRFIGRRAELEIITARLNGPQPQGSAIVGPRRIGKSSLLHYLYQPRHEETLRCAANQQIIYLDAQQGECTTPDAFRRTLTQKLLATQPADRRTREGKQRADLQSQLARDPFCTWEMARTAITLLPVHPVICLDEFETLLREDFDNRFFDALRSWANEGILTWITASAQPLTTLGKEHNLTSPFFNLLATVQIGELTDRETDELLDQANPTPHRFAPNERRLLRSLASNHPYHLQIVAWQMWNEKAHHRPIVKQRLAHFLCQQPNPPAHCAKRAPMHAGWKVAMGLLLLVVILVAVLTWRDPVFVRGVISACWSGLQQLFSYWDEVGNAGELLGGILFLLAGGGVVLSGIHQRRRLWKILQDLWKKWTP